MKKIRILNVLILCFLMSLVILPMAIQAEETCSSHITITSIDLEEMAGHAEERKVASIQGQTVYLDVKMYEPGDMIEYQLKVLNASSEDFYLDQNSFSSESEYIHYDVYTEDGSNIIKSSEEKLVTLKVSYQNEVPSGSFEGNAYTNTNQIQLNLSDENPNIQNPKTGINIPLLLGIVVVYAVLIGVVLRKNQLAKNLFLIVGSLCMLPVITQALCYGHLMVDVQVQVEKKKTCEYEGELVQGAEYVNGQYTYRYGQEYIGNGNWSDIENDGWGMMLTDQESTDPVTTKMCTSINSKPITNMRCVFYGSKSSLIDVSSFDTSEVTTMRAMFIYSTTPVVVGLDKFDTSKVTNMSLMFRKTAFTELDLSSFDTSKVTTMDSMFHMASVESLSINHFDTSSLEIMEFMFYGCTFEELDISHFDLSNVTTVKSIFRISNIKKVYVKDQVAYDKLNASSFKPADLVIEIKSND